ncbi:MAG: hypothetical protein ACRD6W_15335 [Nitrososphaerales archaeon]
MGIMSPPPGRRKYPLVRTTPPEEEKLPPETHACDRCGYSEDGGMISAAKAVFRKGKEALYFCAHHTKSLGVNLMAQGYDGRPL